MSSNLGVLGKQVFQEVMGIERKKYNILPNGDRYISWITNQLDEMENVGISPERILLLQGSIQAFSN